MGAGGIAGGAAVGAVTSKAIAGIAVTAIIAGGAVEAKRVAVHHPVKPAAVPAATSIVHSPKQTTGGASLAAVPSTTVEKHKEKPAHKSQTEPKSGGATGAVGPTDTGGAAPADPKADTKANGSAGEPGQPAASGSTSGPPNGTTDTGGAPLPPVAAQPDPPPVGTSGVTTPGATGATGP
jgi:hypothetical protein